MVTRQVATIALALALTAPRAAEVEERRAVGGLAAHLAATFDEIAACQFSPSGDYVIFDRRAHTVSTATRGADAPTRIVQIGSETGRIIRPSAFDSAPDGSFVVADARGIASGCSSSFRRVRRSADSRCQRRRAQITLGHLVLSGLGPRTPGSPC